VPQMLAARLFNGGDIMRLMIIGMLNGCDWQHGCFCAAATEAAEAGFNPDRLSQRLRQLRQGRMRMGYSQTEAAGYCTRRCGGGNARE